MTQHNTAGIKDISAIGAPLKAFLRGYGGEGRAINLHAHPDNPARDLWSPRFRREVLRSPLKSKISRPTEKGGAFDLTGEINWDLRIKTLKSDSGYVDLNNAAAIRKAVFTQGAYGAIIALGNYEYTRTGKHYPCHKATKIFLHDLLFVIIRRACLDKLDSWRIGASDSGKRPPAQYMLDIDRIDEFEHRIVQLS